MKIRYVLHNAYGTGGTIRTVVNQANAMCRTHDVEIASVYRTRDKPVFPLDERVRLVSLTDLRDDGSRWTDPQGTNSRFVRKTRRFRNPLPHRYDFRYKRWDPVVDTILVRYFRAQRDGVLVTTRPGLNLMSAWFAPSRLVRVGQDHMNLGTYKPALREAMLRAYPRLDAVTVLTEADLAAYRAALGHTGLRVERIPNGIPDRPAAPAGGRGRTVLAAGRLTPQKGFDLLVEAFGLVRERHPDWELAIFGEGRLRGGLTEQIKELGLGGHVHLRGMTRHLDRELARASVFALSSRFEGLPMVLLEAMDSGLPVVAFDCPTGPAEVVEDGVNGLLIPREDTAALAEGLCRLIEDAALRESFGRAARRTSARYEMPAVAESWERLFTELTAA
ncbi:glycosyltransferase family 4 protein [Actinoplanes sp. NPDC049316]|uniref:glycosyltransferase family 4 protein n=1 Tax=Actinoplanes sp. NPDC049316 TaxID=3154727 RepID=UPI003424A197